MEAKNEKSNRQFATFYIGERLYGIDVQRVQEITRSMPMTRVPLAPSYVRGLINLRGQLATAIGVRDLFKTKDKDPESNMNVVCQVDGLLLALVVDRIGDVIEASQENFEFCPDTVSEHIKKYMDGVYKIANDLLSIIDIGKISHAIQKQVA